MIFILYPPYLNNPIAQKPKFKRPYRAFEFWLCLACNPRTDIYQDLIKIGDEIENVKQILGGRG